MGKKRSENANDFPRKTLSHSDRHFYSCMGDPSWEFERETITRYGRINLHLQTVFLFFPVILHSWKLGMFPRKTHRTCVVYVCVYVGWLFVTGLAANWPLSVALWAVCYPTDPAAVRCLLHSGHSTELAINFLAAMRGNSLPLAQPERLVSGTDFR